MQFAEIIVKIREKKNWLQEDIAAFLGVDDSTLSKIGKHRELHWQHDLKLMALCEELGIKLSEDNIQECIARRRSTVDEAKRNTKLARKKREISRRAKKSAPVQNEMKTDTKIESKKRERKLLTIHR